LKANVLRKGRRNVTRQVLKKWYGEETRLKVSFWNLEQARIGAESELLESGTSKNRG
jgi:hypothetical protein